jgi:hypothetical protein
MKLSDLYLVFDPGREDRCYWLSFVEGPFRYPRWVREGGGEAMPFVLAQDYANAYGSRQAIAVGVARAGHESILLKEADDRERVRRALLEQGR